MAGDPLVERVNRLDQAGFVEKLGAVYEHSPWVAARAWEFRPFDGLDSLHRAMQRVLEAASGDAQLALIRAHPDLAGKLARAGALEPASALEQGTLGLDRLDDAAFERFDWLNRAYRERFGIPFIIAVRDHTRDSVIAAFETRLGDDAATEIATALEQIGRIARHRLEDLDLEDRS